MPLQHVQREPTMALWGSSTARQGELGAWRQFGKQDVHEGAFFFYSAVPGMFKIKTYLINITGLECVHETSLQNVRNMEITGQRGITQRERSSLTVSWTSSVKKPRVVIACRASSCAIPWEVELVLAWARSLFLRSVRNTQIG